MITNQKEKEKEKKKRREGKRRKFLKKLQCFGFFFFCWINHKWEETYKNCYCLQY